MPRMRIAFALVLAVSVSWGTLDASAADFTPEYVRDQMSLHGRWDWLDGQGDGEIWKPAIAAAAGPWQAIELPGPLKPGVARRALIATRFVWARRRFELTAAQAARGAVLRWGGIRFGAAAWINGTKVTEHGPIGPHAAMLPAGVLKSGRNELLLRVSGWAGLVKSRSGYPLVPVGASTQGWGGMGPAVEDDIWLDFHDGLYVEHALAIPDVTSSEVTFRVRLQAAAARPGRVELTARVRPDDGSAVVGQETISFTAGEDPVEVTVPVKDAKLWTPQACHLYTAELVAAAKGRPLDTVRFRFGMRRIRVEEGHYRLNGRPLWLRGSNLVTEWRWGGRESRFNKQTKAYIVDEARAMSLNCFRTHTSPPPASWLNVCDEHGTMIWAELPVLYNYADFRFTPAEREIFHRNVLLDATGWVTKLWNHPSIVMWVLSNESRRDIAWESGAYHDHVVGLDPTRPTMRTGCRAGTAENVDLHTCGNVSGGSEGDHILACRAAARKKDPRRTLTNSEYMNFLGGRDNVITRLVGDARSPDAPMAYAELALEHTEALRRLEFDGILPYMYAGWTHFRTGRQWRPEFPTPMAAALHSSMAPVLASLDLFDRNFIAGRTVTTPLVLINETRSDALATLQVCVTPRHPQLVPDEPALKAAVWRESREVKLEADSVETIEIEWPVPEREGVYWLAAVLRRPGLRPVVSQREVHAIDPEKTAAGLRRPRVLLLGGSPVIGTWLRDGGIEFAADLAGGVAEADVALVWDADRIEESRRRTYAGGLKRIAEAGGRVVVLAQKRWSWTDLADLNLHERSASRAFTYPGADHPVLDGIDRPYLMRWNGLPGRISRGHVAGPALETARKLLWAEAPGRPVLTCLPIGEGEILICQLMLRNRITRGEPTYDPVADRLLRNLIGR